jgi:hypothetical protein
VIDGKVFNLLVIDAIGQIWALPAITLQPIYGAFEGERNKGLGTFVIFGLANSHHRRDQNLLCFEIHGRSGHYGIFDGVSFRMLLGEHFPDLGNGQRAWRRLS